MLETKKSNANQYCKICGSKTSKIFHKYPELKYYYCKACEFISKDERFILSPEKEYRNYNNHNNSINDPEYVDYFKKFLHSAVLKYCGSGKLGLDFGSGPSPVLAMILERDYNYNMDIYDLYYSPLKVYQGKKYDLVTSTEVTEHLKNPLSYFQIFRNCLKKEGLLSIMTLFYPNNQEQFLEWYYIRDKTHISFYTPKTMEIIGEKTGLKVIYTDHARYISFKPK
ncbi:MAG: class I SAM-dependent methyltransferase [Candidatus Humimicrobiaceae bacterium]